MGPRRDPPATRGVWECGGLLLWFLTALSSFSLPVCGSRARPVAFAEFWGDIAKEFYWKSQHTGPFLKYNFDVTKGKIFIEWMKGATTNICYNLLDRNVNEKKLGDKIAFYW